MSTAGSFNVNVSDPCLKVHDAVESHSCTGASGVGRHVSELGVYKLTMSVKITPPPLALDVNSRSSSSVT